MNFPAGFRSSESQEKNRPHGALKASKSTAVLSGYVEDSLGESGTDNMALFSGKPDSI